MIARKEKKIRCLSFVRKLHLGKTEAGPQGFLHI